MEKIRIKTKSGKMIERNATVTNWIDNDGCQFSTAIVGNAYYTVVDRDFYGAIYSVK